MSIALDRLTIKTITAAPKYLKAQQSSVFLCLLLLGTLLKGAVYFRSFVNFQPQGRQMLSLVGAIMLLITLLLGQAMRRDLNVALVVGLPLALLIMRITSIAALLVRWAAMAWELV